MKLKKGHILEITTMEEGNLWEVIEIFGDVIVFQDLDEKSDKFGTVNPLFMMRKSEILASPHFKVKNA